MIEVKDLTMVYKSGKGIFDISFSIKEGEVLGYLGPNGAGKTTTIRNLLGFVSPKSGVCTIDGLDCRRDAAKIHQFTGYIAGEISFFDDMNGLEMLDFMCAMRGTHDLTHRTKLLDRFGLDAKQEVRKMSKGMKQKLAIVTAFMHDPKVYILDEPSSGLDPLMQSEFIELVREEKRRGKTILLSSHMFEEVERSCDNVAIIKDGQLSALKHIAQLKLEQRKLYTVTLNDIRQVEKLQKAGFAPEKVTDNRVCVAIGNDFNAFLRVLAACDVAALEETKQTLEQIFMQYYAKGGESHE